LEVNIGDMWLGDIRIGVETCKVGNTGSTSLVKSIQSFSFEIFVVDFWVTFLFFVTYYIWINKIIIYILISIKQ